jgi:hypothetical protein
MEKAVESSFAMKQQHEIRFENVADTKSKMHRQH